MRRVDDEPDRTRAETLQQGTRRDHRRFDPSVDVEHATHRRQGIDRRERGRDLDGQHRPAEQPRHAAHARCRRCPRRPRPHPNGLRPRRRGDRAGPPEGRRHATPKLSSASSIAVTRSSTSTTSPSNATATRAKIAFTSAQCTPSIASSARSTASGDHLRARPVHTAHVDVRAPRRRPNVTPPRRTARLAAVPDQNRHQMAAQHIERQRHNTTLSAATERSSPSCGRPPRITRATRLTSASSFGAVVRGVSSPVCSAEFTLS